MSLFRANAAAILIPKLRVNKEIKMSLESKTLNVMILFCLVVFVTFLYDVGIDVVTTSGGAGIPKPRKVMARDSKEPYYVNYPNISGRRAQLLGLRRG